MPRRQSLGRIISVGLLTLGLAMLATPITAQSPETQPTVSAGKRVSVEYTLKLDDQSVLGSNVGKTPLTYIHGAGTMAFGSCPSAVARMIMSWSASVLKPT